MIATVIKSTGSWYTVQTREGKKIECRMKGKFRMEGIRNTNPVAVGDQVEIEMDSGEETGSIIRIEPRKNYIIRRSINLSKQTQILAANIDRAFLVVTLSSPRTSLGFIDRFLLTAEAYGIPVDIVFNKSDMYSDEELKTVKELTLLYEKLGYSCILVSALHSGKEIETMRERMSGKVNLFAGHSGVGKSTLINALDPGLKLRTGELSEAHDKGMHTTTFAEMFELSTGGYIVDTPGIKELGLVHMERQELSHYFPEMRNLLNQCRFNNCKHVNEPNCAVILAVKNGEIALSRYTCYLGIISGEELEKNYDD